MRLNVVTSATMAGPFLPPQVVLDGFKERPEALETQGMLPPHVYLRYPDRKFRRR